MRVAHSSKPDNDRVSRIWAARKALKLDELYKEPQRCNDGLYHCIYEGKDKCNHKPTKSKAAYYRSLDGHLKPFYCEICSAYYARPDHFDFHASHPHDVPGRTEHSNSHVTASSAGQITPLAVVQGPLHKILGRAHVRLARLEKVEVDALELVGAFNLPSRSLCDELVASYFRQIAPILPVINENQFMEQYKDEDNPPSLLLLQAVLLAGSRTHYRLAFLDRDGSPSQTVRDIYRSAKSLYFANVEDDPIAAVQALILIGWYCGDFENTTDKLAHWVRLAITVAQSRGLHRSVEKSERKSNLAQTKLRRRIWWTLFTLDRSIAIHLGQPVLINTADCDVEFISKEDLLESDNPTTEDQLYTIFFVQYVSLCSIIGMVLSQHYSLASQAKRDGSTSNSCKAALTSWSQNCPKQMDWEPSCHNFWSALLHTRYNAIICLLYYTEVKRVGYVEDASSSNTAFEAAAKIASIAKVLTASKEIWKCPEYFAQDVFRALSVYATNWETFSANQEHREYAEVCIQALKDISRVWAIPIDKYAYMESVIQSTATEVSIEQGTKTREIDEEIQEQIWGDAGHKIYQEQLEPSGTIMECTELDTESWAGTDPVDLDLPHSSQDTRLEFRAPIQPRESSGSNISNDALPRRLQAVRPTSTKSLDPCQTPKEQTSVECIRSPYEPRLSIAESSSVHRSTGFTNGFIPVRKRCFAEADLRADDGFQPFRQAPKAQVSLQALPSQSCLHNPCSAFPLPLMPPAQLSQSHRNLLLARALHHDPPPYVVRPFTGSPAGPDTFVKAAPHASFSVDQLSPFQAQMADQESGSQHHMYTAPYAPHPVPWSTCADGPTRLVETYKDSSQSFEGIVPQATPLAQWQPICSTMKSAEGQTQDRTLKS